ncbi:MAG TPA: hypothetical protein VHE54_19660, partial [Puia sp.]|nr:hypothetical protein [Puia sp.]
MDEYPISRTYKIVGLLFGALFFVGGIAALCALAYPSVQSGQVVKLILGIVLTPLSYYLYRESTRLSVTVDADTLVVQHAFSSRSIALKEIDGYRVGEKDAFFLIPSGGGKKLQVPKGIKDREGLLNWIRDKYADVDARERAAETESLLEDEKFGSTREERDAALKKASAAAKAGRVAGFILCTWAFLYPKPLTPLMFGLLVAPFAGAWFTWRYKGLMRLT